MAPPGKDLPPTSSNHLRRSGAPTLADLAREAGVSVSTAGRVMRDRGWPVDEGLKTRVLQAAAALGYVPNLLARTLRGDAPALVGLVAGNMLDPYYGEIAETVTRHAESAHHMLAMVCNMQRDPLLELNYCRQLWAHRVAGLILAGGGYDQVSHHEELASTIAQMTRGGVVVTTLSPRGLEAPVFCVDNRLVGRMAAGALIEAGHRHVGIATGRVQNQVRRERLEGLVAALEEAGVKHWISQPAPPEQFTQALEALLAAHPEITGLIATTHMISLRVVNAVRHSGRTIPGDLSVVAIGNARLSEWTMPHLSYVDLRLEACSRAALDYIAARVSGQPAETASTFAPRLVCGQSLRKIGP